MCVILLVVDVVNGVVLLCGGVSVGGCCGRSCLILRSKGRVGVCSVSSDGGRELGGVSGVRTVINVMAGLRKGGGGFTIVFGRREGYSCSIGLGRGGGMDVGSGLVIFCSRRDSGLVDPGSFVMRCKCMVLPGKRWLGL